MMIQVQGTDPDSILLRTSQVQQLTFSTTMQLTIVSAVTLNQLESEQDCDLSPMGEMIDV